MTPIITPILIPVRVVHITIISDLYPDIMGVVLVARIRRHLHLEVFVCNCKHLLILALYVKCTNP